MVAFATSVFFCGRDVRAAALALGIAHHFEISVCQERCGCAWSRLTDYIADATLVDGDGRG